MNEIHTLRRQGVALKKNCPPRYLLKYKENVNGSIFKKTRVSMCCCFFLPNFLQSHLQNRQQNICTIYNNYSLLLNCLNGLHTVT